MDQTSEATMPLSSFVSPLLTDMYQISMAYAYWRAGRHNEKAIFELFFRKNPFSGEYVIFTGMDQVIHHLRSFKFTPSDINYLKSLPSLKHADPAFFDYLTDLDCSGIVVDAMKDGSVVFPRVTLIRVQGPLIVGQLLETTLLNLVNFPSLIATNAARMRLAAGPAKKLLEFGLRRAQGPDGGVSASRYAYVGGFDGTSNVMAGKCVGIPVSGTHAHAFVQSHTGWNDIKDPFLNGKNLVERVMELRRSKEAWMNTNESELVAFVAYAQSFPEGFLALIDTYDTMASGLENFIIVALALVEHNYKPLGIRLDSGDLAYLSTEARRRMDEAADEHNCPPLRECKVVASNDINEDVLLSLKNQGNAIDIFGIGTHLVTCQAQPALGCVYKLVEIEGSARIKLSQDIAKVMIPGDKSIYRLLDKNGQPLLDLLTRRHEPAPIAGKRVLCRHPFQENKRVNVIPTTVIPLLETVWDGPNKTSLEPVSPFAARAFAMSQVEAMRSDIMRPLNPTPYKVSVSSSLYTFLHELWQENMPVRELS